ncbi:efflux RND transporter periplasmic adaptor subunit [Rheinheimera sp. 4Y26]|uniref:efflux RND transporter periplasmic adaptor subunit n=1 Tax=Rheinheimera sp. 4Y26 TaxID=2977811 RepID=UPI0021B0D90B|nr:HlyD family efflux transporter periplasmic adaptor subunit [Rheinheimera sp. 4Y26]MCT6699808.1 HlyD family efflux transporter periplasmic adaptor subunit [Rheinheimera sp. 4Y26]
MAANGVLKSKSGQRIVNQVEGKVLAIHFVAGQKISKNAVLFELENLEVRKRYTLAQHEKRLAQAEMQSVVSELQQDKSQLAYELALSQGEYKVASTELAAKEKLQSAHIISAIELERQRVLAGNAHAKQKLLEQQFHQFDQQAKSKLEAATLKVEQSLINETMAAQEVAMLKVRSEIDGVLQEIDTSLHVGEWLVVGKNLALVSDTSQLYAEVRINASDVQKVHVGQVADVNIKGLPISAKVTRIAPRAEHNQVQVDMELTGQLPATAMPFVEVSATITLVHKELALQIEKPSYLRADNNQPRLWVKKQGMSDFEWYPVEVGLITANTVEILSGLEKGDLVALDVHEDDL